MIVDGRVWPTQHSAEDFHCGCACANCTRTHCARVSDQLAERRHPSVPVIESRRTSPNRGAAWFTFTPTGISLGTK